MRAIMMLYLVGLGFACQGCAPFWQAARTSLIQPLIYRRVSTDAHECHRNNELAEAAWKDFICEHPEIEKAYAKDFASGFKGGFADYLYLGGTGAPPPVPPLCYWNYKYETPEGHKAIQNWFAGFRVGAESAQRSGYRQLVVVPASTSIASSNTQTSPSPSTAPSMSPKSGTRTEEMLPPPRQVPNSDNPAIKKPPTTGAPPSLPPPPPVPSHLPEEVLPLLRQTSEAIEPPGQAPNLDNPAAKKPLTTGTPLPSPPPVPSHLPKEVPPRPRQKSEAVDPAMWW